MGPLLVTDQECVLMTDAGRDLDVSLGDVVADGVIEQVGDQALQQPRIASRRGWGERRADVEVEACGLRLPHPQDLGGNGREVEALAPLQSRLAARERQQPIDHLLQVLLGGEHALVGRAQRGEVRVRVGERDLDQGSLARQRRAQLVRGVGDELALRLERSVEPPEQVIEGVPEFLELVLRAIEGQALVQAGGGDPSGRAGDGPDRSQHPAGDEPASEEGEYGHDRQRDSRLDQQLVRVGSALCGLTGPTCAS